MPSITCDDIGPRLHNVGETGYRYHEEYAYMDPSELVVTPTIDQGTGKY